MTGSIPCTNNSRSRALLPGDDDVHVIESEFGHDGFLLETEAVGAVVEQALRS